MRLTCQKNLMNLGLEDDIHSFFKFGDQHVSKFKTWTNFNFVCKFRD